MIQDPKPNLSMILNLVRAAERRHGITLEPKDLEFVAKASSDFLLAFVEKFVSGAVEHADDGGDFVSNVNHNTELEKEILDLWSYYKGMQCKKLQQQQSQ